MPAALGAGRWRAQRAQTVQPISVVPGCPAFPFLLAVTFRPLLESFTTGVWNSFTAFSNLTFRFFPSGVIPVLEVPGWSVRPPLGTPGVGQQPPPLAEVRRSNLLGRYNRPSTVVPEAGKGPDHRPAPRPAIEMSWQGNPPVMISIGILGGMAHFRSVCTSSQMGARSRAPSRMRDRRTRRQYGLISQ